MDDGALSIALVRMAERIMVDVIAGFAIYFGYRLFLTLPLETQHSGKLTLPGMSVTLSRVGPGVFFAVMGALVLYTSVTSTVAVEHAPGKSSVSAAMPGEPKPHEVARAAGAIQTLNCMQQSASIGGKPDWKDEVEVATRDAKLALLAGVWNAKAWGDFRAFRAWAHAGAGSVNLEVANIYKSLEACPRA